jgi:hypothetical protein
VQRRPQRFSIRETYTAKFVVSCFRFQAQQAGSRRFAKLDRLLHKLAAQTEPQFVASA